MTRLDLPRRPVRALAAAARRDERGATVSFAAAILVPALFVLVGLVVDGAGKIEAARHADAVANAAARAGGDAAATEVVAALSPESVAARAARRALNASGLPGTVSVQGRTLTVTATSTYDTYFLTVIGVGSLQGRGQATAQITPVDPP